MVEEMPIPPTVRFKVVVNHAHYKWFVQEQIQTATSVDHINPQQREEHTAKEEQWFKIKITLQVITNHEL